MSSPARRPRVCNYSGVDGISKLPDSVLSHILSLLKTEEAVATRLVSKRWKSLWRNIHSLEFDDTFFRMKDKKSGGIKFAHFVNKVLIFLNQQSIEKFLLFIDYCEVYDVPTWIATAIDRKVKELELYVSSGPCTQLPSCIFSCKTLEVLVLDGNICLNAPSVVCLSNLKTLRLETVTYMCDESVRNLLSGCSSLNTLRVQREKYDNVVTYSISSPTLRNLEFRFLHDPTVPRNLDYKLEINAPELRDLHLLDDLSRDISVENLRSLDEAYVELSLIAYQNSIYSRGVVELLRGLCNVKYLQLDLFVSEALSLIDPFPSFPRLIHLEAECCDWSLLLDLVKGMNKLQFLDLSEMQTHNSWNKPKEVPLCFLSCLQKVSVTQFGGEEVELAAVAYILKNAKVLRKMILQTVSYGLNVETRYQLLQKVSKFSRGSHECEITFS